MIFHFLMYNNKPMSNTGIIGTTGVGPVNEGV